MPRLIKVAEFAKDIRVARNSLYKAAKNGTIKINDGFIDVTAKETIEYIQGARERKQDKIQTPSGNGNGSPPRTIEKKELENARLVKQNRELDLKYRKARNELLERKDVRMVFNRLYAIQVSKLHGLGFTLTPDIAVIFESTDNAKMLKTTETIDVAVFATLEEIKKNFNDYLLSVEAEEMDDG